MKSKFSLYILLIAILTTSIFNTCCKKDNDNSPDDLKEKIVGRWNYLKNVNHYTTNGNEETEIENDGAGNYWQFNEDNTFKLGLDDGEGDGIWNLTGNKIKFSTNDYNNDYGFGGVLWDIQKITNTELVLYARQTSGQDYHEVSIYMSR